MRKEWGWTLERRLQTYSRRKPKRVETDYLDNSFSSEKAMCKHHNMPYSVYLNRKYRGLSNQQCLDNRLHHDTFDHLGSKFRSEKEMCKVYNVKYYTFKDRKQKGWSVQECLCGKDIK